MLATVAGGCNSKEETDEDDAINYVETTTAVTGFRLSADSKRMAHMDSVFFSIDLDEGVIWNQDSLPKGTDITRLVPVVTFSRQMSAVSITVKGATTMADSTFNYKDSPNDSIDFSGTTVMSVTAPDGTSKRDYRIKINVHTIDIDSLAWSDTAVSPLPSRLGAPRRQKSVDLSGTALCLLEESDGSYTLSRNADLYSAQWEKTELTPGFTPAIESLTAAGRRLYMLDSEGTLHTSADGLAWENTGERWASIICGFGEAALGIRTDGEGLTHCHYPADAPVADGPVAADFPLTGHTNGGTFTTKWSATPVVLICGGRMASGELTGATWGFDGQRWTPISEHATPPMEGATLVPYYVFRPAGIFKKDCYDGWLVVGGRLADGSYNRTVYMSDDNGVNWRKGSELTNLPDYLPATTGSDNIVMTTRLSSNLSDAWKTGDPAAKGRRAPGYDVDGDTLSWECPFIYLIGGYRADGSLSDSIWRGALVRLRQAPII